MGLGEKPEQTGESGAPLRESTAGLIRRVRSGEAEARDQLMARCLPLLRRWAHGRYEEAARYARRAQRILVDTLGPGHRWSESCRAHLQKMDALSRGDG